MGLQNSTLELWAPQIWEHRTFSSAHHTNLPGCVHASSCLDPCRMPFCHRQLHPLQPSMHSLHTTDAPVHMQMRTSRSRHRTFEQLLDRSNCSRRTRYTEW